MPGAVTADKRQVALTAYNNATDRTNVFNQTDVTSTVTTGPIRHTLLAGAEFGHQLTDNFRNTGILQQHGDVDPGARTTTPTISTPVTFRQSATDADNHLVTNVAAAYAQDQVELSAHVQAVAGLRFDRFDLTYHNNRNGDTLERPDNLVSPRAGVVVKPIAPVSVYSSYSVSYLPGSGDQFSSLTNITEQLKPEKFHNYEVGAKWDPFKALSLTTAVYRLDRTNTRSTDPNDPTRIVQTGSQRTNGYELGANGRLTSAWSIAGGYAYQDAFVTSATTAARAGAQVGPGPAPHAVALEQLSDPAASRRRRLASSIAATCSRRSTTPSRCRATRGSTSPASTRSPAVCGCRRNVENLFDKTYIHQRRQQHQHLTRLSAHAAGRADRDLLARFPS